MEPVVPSSEFKTEFTQGTPKAAATSTGAKSESLLMVPVEKLVVPAGLNVRIHDDAYEQRIDEVCESIMENGFYKHMPLPGYAGKEGDLTFIYITGGFTRLAALKRAIERGTPIETVPVVLKNAGTSMKDLNYALANDNTGAPLTPYEKGIVVKRGLAYGDDEETIARKMNVSVQYVKDLLYLHSLPQQMQNLVITRTIGAGHAIKMSRQHGNAEALKIVLETLTAEKGEETAALAAGNGEDMESGTRTPARVTPRQTRSTAAGKGTGKKTTPKAQLGITLAAIDYAIALPVEGIEFLSRWRKEDADALAEVMATVNPPTKKAQAEAKRKAKAAEKKKKEDAKAKKKADAAKKKADAEKKKAERAAAAAAKAAGNTGADIGL